MIVKNPFYTIPKAFNSIFKKGLNSIVYTTHTTNELSRILSAESPIWNNFKTYAMIYNSVSVIRIILDIKAQATANARIIVRDAKTQEILPYTSPNKYANKLYRLLANPNPLQSTREFFRDDQIFHDVFGISYIYGSVPAGLENRVSLDTIDTLQPLQAHFMKTYYTGRFFDTLSINDIIAKYEFYSSAYRKEFIPSTMLVRSNVSMDIPSSKSSMSIGANELSKLFAVQKEVSNFIMSLESRNVIGKKRGALGIFTSMMKIGGDIMPLSDKLSLDVDEAFNKYGTLEGQQQFIHTKAPLKFERVSQSTKDLMLFEESWQDTIACSHIYGVPEILTKLSKENPTYKNLKEAIIDLYQRTTIPEMKDRMRDLALFLKLEEFGLEIEASYDHIAVLQENQKEQADTAKLKTETGETLFLAGAYTYNNWLTYAELTPITEPWGDLRIFELDDRQISIILGQMQTEKTEPQN